MHFVHETQKGTVLQHTGGSGIPREGEGATTWSAVLMSPLLQFVVHGRRACVWGHQVQSGPVPGNIYYLCV